MVVTYCAIAGQQTAAPAAPPLQPQLPRSPAAQADRKCRSAGSRGDLTGRRQAEGRIHFWLRGILRRPHPHDFGELVEALADSFDFRLVILVSELTCALLAAGHGLARLPFVPSAA